MKSIILVLGYLAISTPCFSIKPRSVDSGNVMAFNSSDANLDRTLGYSLRIAPRGHRHEHKSGEPYLANTAYCGYELPDDKSQWEPAGSSEETNHIRHAPRYQSINPATGRLRKGKCYCDGRGIQIVLPEDCECCSTWTSYMECRTYKLKPTPYTMMTGVVSVIANGRAAAAEQDAKLPG